MSIHEVARAVWTLVEFAAAHRISRTHLYELIKQGRGPRLMRVGRRVLVTHEAAAEWRRQMEQQSAGNDWRA